MKIYFVRHGQPDYANDCLTELGHQQAAAAAERLRDCGIEKVFSSTKGRAMQTAEYTAKELGLEIIPCDFMREILWNSIDGEPILRNGDPWFYADLLASEGKSLNDGEWYAKEPYCKSKIIPSAKTVNDGLDAWLAELGYQRESEYYRVVREPTAKTVAMFSHGGSSSVALSRIFNIPLPMVLGIFRPELTSVTVVEFSENVGELICPRLLLFNDEQHIVGIDTKNVYEM